LPKIQKYFYLQYYIKNVLLGYGSAKLIPLIIKIPFIFSSPDSRIFHLLLIEEPEANLHPKLQSKLAELFMVAYKKYPLMFLIETHSEYLIRKLQYLTAEKAINTEDIRIYYLNDSKNVAEKEEQVKEIKILEDGSLSEEFGPGFFDETINLKLELLKLKNLQKN